MSSPAYSTTNSPLKSFLVGTTPRFFPTMLQTFSGSLESSGPASLSLWVISAVWFFLRRSERRIKALTDSSADKKKNEFVVEYAGEL